MNILMLGLNDPAGMMIAFAQALNLYTEHTARVISYRTMYAQDYDYDLEIPRLNDEWGEVEELLQKSDVFHFHMLLDETYQLGPFALSDYTAGKGLLYHHHGTYDHQCFLGQQEAYREKYKRTGKRAIVSTPDLLEYLPMATWQPNLVPLDDPAFQPRLDHFLSGSPFRVVQAPTRKWHKNTQEFQSVCDELSLERDDFVYEILQGLSFRDCLASKRSAHACFDHMQGWFGIASLESLAQGVPTLAGLSEEVIKHISDFTGVEEHPWRVVRDSEQLKAELSALADDRAAALEIGKSSRAFMEQYWTEERVLHQLTEVYNTL